MSVIIFIMGILLIVFIVITLTTIAEQNRQDKYSVKLAGCISVLESKIKMIIDGLEAKETYGTIYSYELMPKQVYSSKKITDIKKEISMLHDYLGIRVEPSKTEPEKLVKKGKR